jgi:1,4-alpha-glucan branching enzyme
MHQRGPGRPHDSISGGDVNIPPAPSEKNASLDSRTVELVAAGRHSDPFSILGPHEIAGKKLAVRAFAPSAVEGWVVEPRRITSMSRIHDAGFFEGVLDDYLLPFRDYKLRFHYASGAEI